MKTSKLFEDAHCYGCLLLFFPMLFNVYHGTDGAERSGLKLTKGKSFVSP